MRRRAHILRENHRTTTPTEMIFVDTESFIHDVAPGVEHHTLRMGYAIYLHRRHGKGADTREVLAFRTLEEFWGLVERRARPGHQLHLFAHNWNYDAGILGVSTWVQQGGWNVLQYVNERPPLIIKLRKYTTERTDVPVAGPEVRKPLILITPNGQQMVDKATLAELTRDGQATAYHMRILDSLNFFGQALSALGKVLGMEKGEMSDFRTATDEEMAPYNQRDTEILAEMMVRYFEFIEEHDMGNFAPTLAGQAFNAYRHAFMRDDIYIHDNEAVCSLERAAYHGGRTEVFTMGRVDGDLHYLDVNSLYPSVMREAQVPTKLIDHGLEISLEDARRVLKQGYALVADCYVETEEPVYAKVDRGERLIFPVGSFWTALTTPEILYGLEHGLIQRMARWAVYEQHRIYRQYVERFYQMRLDFRESGDEVYAYIVKGLLNSLYGKMGQKGLVYQNTGVPAEQDDSITIAIDADGVRHQQRVRMGQIQELIAEEETRDSFPAIAAHITALARMKMWRLFTKAGLEHVHYTDTDSLIVDAVGYERLRDEIDPTVLGMLKVEEQAPYADFRGPKDYNFGDTTEHIKGVSKRARKIQHDTYEQQQFVSWDRLASQGRDGYIEVRRVTKVLERVYRKGYAPVEGGRVSPIRFHNDFSYGVRRLDTLEEIEQERREVARRPDSPEKDDHLGSLQVLREALIASSLNEEDRQALEGARLEEGRLMDHLGAIKDLRDAIERPPWSSGLSYDTILAIAKHEGRNPYEPDWGDSIDPVVVKEFRESARPRRDDPARLRRRLRQVRETIRTLEARANQGGTNATQGVDSSRIPEGAGV